MFPTFIRLSKLSFQIQIRRFFSIHDESIPKTYHRSFIIVVNNIFSYKCNQTESNNEEYQEEYQDQGQHVEQHDEHVPQDGAEQHVEHHEQHVEHHVEHHEHTNQSSSSANQNRDGGRHHCYHCDYVFESRDDLERHVAEISKKNHAPPPPNKKPSSQQQQRAYASYN